MALLSLLENQSSSFTLLFQAVYFAMFALQNDAIEQIQLDFLCLLTSLHLILQYLFIWFYSICSFDYPIFVHLILQYLFRSAQYFALPLPSSIWPSMEEKVCAMKYNYHLMILIFLWQNSSIHPLTRPLRFLQCWLTSFVGPQVCVGSSAKFSLFWGYHWTCFVRLVTHQLSWKFIV